MLTNVMSPDTVAADMRSVAAKLDRDVIGAPLALDPGTRLLLGPAGGVMARPALRPSRIPAQPGVTWRVPADTSEEWPAPAPVTMEGAEVRRPPRLRPSRLDRTHLVSQLAAPEEAAGLLPLERARLGSSADPVDEAVSQVLGALDQVTGTPEIARLWDHVVDQVRTPRITSRGNPAQLYAAQVVDAIDALTPVAPRLAAGRSGQPPPTDEYREEVLRRKQQVLERVFSVLLHAAETRIAGTEAADPQPEQEEKQLTGVVRANVAEYAGGYREVRTMLLAKFGALDVGTAKAIERMNDFYAHVKETHFLGHKITVHERLDDRLKQAENLLTAEEKQDVATRTSGEFDSLDIRANVNLPFDLSEHALGCAIDLSPILNPNVHGLPYEFIADVTGIDLKSSQEGQLPDDFDVAEVVGRLLFGAAIPAELQRPTAASTRLRAVFRSEKSLAAAMLHIARDRSQLSAEIGASELLERVRMARWEGPRVSWRFANLAIAGHGKLPPPGPAHDSLADLLYPPKPGAPFPEPFNEWDHERHIAELLIMMADVFDRARSFKEDVKGHPPATAAVGTGGLPQFAAYGFANLPPRLISVLRDGAGLQWLGEGGGNRDFMHFQLHLKDRPPRY